MGFSSFCFVLFRCSFICFVCLFNYKFVKAQVSLIFPYIFSVYQQSYFTYGGPSLLHFVLIRTVVVAVVGAAAALPLPLTNYHCHSHTTAVAVAALCQPLRLARRFATEYPFLDKCKFFLVLRSFRVANACSFPHSQSFHTHKAQLRLRVVRVNNNNNFCFFRYALCCFHSSVGSQLISQLTHVRASQRVAVDVDVDVGVCVYAGHL